MVTTSDVSTTWYPAAGSVVHALPGALLAGCSAWPSGRSFESRTNPEQLAVRVNDPSAGLWPSALMRACLVFQAAGGLGSPTTSAGFRAEGST